MTWLSNSNLIISHSSSPSPLPDTTPTHYTVRVNTTQSIFSIQRENRNLHLMPPFCCLSTFPKYFSPGPLAAANPSTWTFDLQILLPFPSHLPSRDTPQHTDFPASRLTLREVAGWQSQSHQNEKRAPEICLRGQKMDKKNQDIVGDRAHQAKEFKFSLA